MTDDVKTAMAQELLAWMKNAGEFVGDQAPALAQELVAYGMAAAIGGVILGFALCGLGYVSAKVAKFEGNEGEVGEFFGWLGSGCGWVFGLIMVTGQSAALMKVYLAPKIYVLETLADLVK